MLKRGLEGGGQGDGPAKFIRAPEEIGDWQCAACGNINFAARVMCNMRACGAARPDLAFAAMPNAVAVSQGEMRANDWICENCGMSNFATRDACFMRKCMAPRPANPSSPTIGMGMGMVSPQFGMLSPPSGMSSPISGRFTPSMSRPMSSGFTPSYIKPFPTESVLQAGAMQEVREGDWICEACGNSNFRTRDACFMRKCLAPRPANASSPNMGMGMVSPPVVHIPQSFQQPRQVGQVQPGLNSFSLMAFEQPSPAGFTYPGNHDVREGDWICAACGNSNYATRTSCFMRKCMAARPDCDLGTSTLDSTLDL